MITEMLLCSTVDKGRYDEEDFCRRLDEELFPKLDGKPMSGPGGYTSQSIREAWRRRVEQKKSWKEAGGHADHRLLGDARIDKAPSQRLGRITYQGPVLRRHHDDPLIFKRRLYQ